MNEDFLDLLSALSDAEARYLIVGGYAVAMHGRPRATKDLDVWVEASDENAPKVMAALRAFGAPLADLAEEDLRQPGTGFMMGRPPHRIDIVTEIDGIDFAEAWPRRTTRRFGNQVHPLIGLEDLITNKRAAGRAQDIADAEALEEIRDADASEENG